MNGRSYDPEYSVRVGRRLRDLRTARGWSLADVSDLTGGNIAVANIGAWERGDRSVPVYRLADLADIYGVPVGSLIPGAEDPLPARSAASEFAAEMSLSRDDLGRYVLAASGPRLTVTVLTADWASAEAFAGLYADLRRGKQDRSAA